MQHFLLNMLTAGHRFVERSHLASVVRMRAYQVGYTFFVSTCCNTNSQDVCPHQCQKRICCVLSDASVFNAQYKSLSFSTSILVVAESVTPVTTNILVGGSQRVKTL